MRSAIPILVLAVGVLAPATTRAQSTPVDTLVSVQADGRLELHNVSGSVTIATWSRDQVRIRARRSGPEPIRIERKGVTLVIQAPRQIERQTRIDYELTVPVSLDLAVHGMRSPVTIHGTEGSVEVHTINGAIDVRGGRDRVELHSVNGPATVVGARGRVEVNGVNQDVTLRDVSGDGVTVNAVNGEVTLENVDARTVDAKTVNGDIRFSGAIRPDGSYELHAHNGRIVFDVPEGTSARVRVSTHRGTLQVDFPVTLEEGEHGKRFDFTLGTGKARIELTSFNGRIEMRRPGS